MERRTKLILLIILAIIILLVGLWILFSPFIRPAVQPPALPPGVSPEAVLPVPQPTAPVVTAPVVLPDIKQLADRASAFIERMGSGSNRDGFRGYDDVMLDASPGFRLTLRSEQQAMRQAHPAAGPAFGRISRVVSIDSTQAVSGADIIPFVLQVQQTEDAGDPSKPTRVIYLQATLSFEKQPPGEYLVNGITWRPIEL